MNADSRSLDVELVRARAIAFATMLGMVLMFVQTIRLHEGLSQILALISAWVLGVLCWPMLTRTGSVPAILLGTAVVATALASYAIGDILGFVLAAVVAILMSPGLTSAVHGGTIAPKGYEGLAASLRWMLLLLFAAWFGVAMRVLFLN